MKWIINNYKNSIIDIDYIQELRFLNDSSVNLIICPNDIQLMDFKNKNYLLGSQDVGYSFSKEELKEMNVEYTIVGHNDKRKKYHETNCDINKKTKDLISIGICPILCIGEEKKEDIKKFLKADLEECLKDVKTNKIIIAYEPVWAIGTGKVPGIEELKDITKYIKIKTKELIGCDPILVYGGSVNLDTINGLNEVKELDGYLIGSASLDIKKLKRLIEVVK